mgnify:FL=1
MPKKINEFFIIMINIINEYKNSEKGNKNTEKLIEQLQNHINAADDEMQNTYLFRYTVRYCSDVNGIYLKESINDFDHWISENQDESDIVIDLDEWVYSDESLDTSFDWYEQKFSSDINQLKKWFIDDYCIWNIEVALQGAEELTDKTKLLLTGP